MTEQEADYLKKAQTFFTRDPHTRRPISIDLTTEQILVCDPLPELGLPECVQLVVAVRKAGTSLKPGDYVICNEGDGLVSYISSIGHDIVPVSSVRAIVRVGE